MRDDGQLCKTVVSGNERACLGGWGANDKAIPGPGWAMSAGEVFGHFTSRHCPARPRNRLVIRWVHTIGRDEGTSRRNDGQNCDLSVCITNSFFVLSFPVLSCSYSLSQLNIL